MKKILILPLLLAALAGSADVLAPYRERAAKIVYRSPEDFQLGKELCDVFAKLAANLPRRRAGQCPVTSAAAPITSDSVPLVQGQNLSALRISGVLPIMEIG